MTEIKELPTLHILSVVTGRNMEDQGIAGVYEVLNWMAAESLFTHQLPRVGREAAPVLLAALPQLQAALDDARAMPNDDWHDREKIDAYRKRWVAALGDTLPVPKLGHAQHERIDPMSELAEKVHPSKIVVVTP